MKKTLLIICMIVITSLANAQKADRSVFGFKGKVTGASISAGYSSYGSYSFGEDGNANNKIYLWDGTEERSYDVAIDNRTKNGFSGDSYYGKLTATVANNHITKIVIKGEKNNNPSTYTCTYSYDNNGNLVKGSEVFVYYVEEGIEYGGGVYGLDNYQRELQKAYEQYQRDLLTNPLRAQAAYDRAVARIERAQRGVGVNTYARTKKTKKTVKADYTYSNYVFDDFGNWISRTYKKGTDYQTQTQTINYDPEYWSQFYWERLEQEGNLQKIEAFYLNPITTATYKNLASKYWNGHILDEVSRKYKNNLDTLCYVSGKTIASAEVSDQALEIVRKYMYNNYVMKERDYARVKQMKDMKRQNIDIFNTNYRRQIEARSEKLKSDSIAFLTNKAQQEFESANYQGALATAKGILTISPSNKTAADLCQKSSYNIVTSKEANNSVQESDYADFINEYATSEYVPEIQNRRALYASSLFNKTTPDEELERVVRLPADEPTSKIVKKRYNKWMFKKNHGRFFHVGLGGEFSAGGANTVGSGELLLRFGYAANILNLVTGVKYNFLTSTSQMFKAPKEVGKAYFERQYLSVPVMLRFNLKHGYEGSTYIGIGTDININTLSAKLRDIEDIKEKEFANKDLSFSPRIAFGGHMFGLELELFAAYDNKNPFNVDYIKTYTTQDGQYLKDICDEKSFDKQIDSDDFINKIRGGLAIRIWF